MDDDRDNVQTILAACGWPMRYKTEIAKKSPTKGTWAIGDITKPELKGTYSKEGYPW